VSGARQLLQGVPFAHAGHVIVDLLTFVPVLVLLLWFVIAAVRDRRKEEKEK
jgi:hypothetical protein